MREKEIEFLIEKLKFYRNVLIAISSGIVVVVYAIINHKANVNSLILVWFGIGSIVFIAIKIKLLEKKIQKLIEGEE